jgi:N-glycosylase/DNA lyase
VTSYLVVRDFSLRHTLECGQFFRWQREDDGYIVQSRDRCFRVRQEGARLYYEGEDAWFVQQFFSLDHDLPAIRRVIDRDPFIGEALDRYWGLRIIRQDPWECLASFLTSIASNIPRITRNLEDMAREKGESFERFSRRLHRFPSPDRLGDEETLRGLHLGFRARYLAQAACLVNAGMMEDLIGCEPDEIRESLMIIPGVAEKVADCVLLYAFGQLDAFPVDTWIRKVVTRLYLNAKPASDRAIRGFADRHFGGYAGYAQQYLYVHSRENWKEIQARPISAKRLAIKTLQPERETTRVAKVGDLVESLLSLGQR